jgi:hypothetical protein
VNVNPARSNWLESSESFGVGNPVAATVKLNGTPQVPPKELGETIFKLSEMVRGIVWVKVLKEFETCNCMV